MAAVTDLTLRLLDQLAAAIENEDPVSAILQKAARLASLTEEHEYRILFQLHSDGLPTRDELLLAQQPTERNKRIEPWQGDLGPPRWDVLTAFKEDRADRRGGYSNAPVAILEQQLLHTQTEMEIARDRGCTEAQWERLSHSEIFLFSVFGRMRNRVATFLMQLERRLSRTDGIPAPGRPHEPLKSDPAAVVAALWQLAECIRYLHTRRAPPLVRVDSEAAVQDLVYCMVRPWITDLAWEGPTDKVASRFVVKDFTTKALQTVIEAKFIRDAAHGKAITKELHDDIKMYRTQDVCKHLIFVVYDPGQFIPDRTALRGHIEQQRSYEGVPLHCHLVVAP